MFSGIVAGTGTVVEVGSTPGAGRRLVVSESVLRRGLADGESVSVAGVCLTVVATESRGLAFDVIGETLRRTTLGDLVVGSTVNLEASLRMGDPIGGHQVQGHVDGVGEVLDADDRGDELRITVRPPQDVLDSLVPQGWVTVDGVSLTVAALDVATFTVALIPATRRITTLGRLRDGDRVNVEGDPLGKHVARWMAARTLEV